MHKHTYKKQICVFHDIGGGDRRRHEKESHPVVVIAYSLYIETPNQRFRPAFLGR